MERPILFSGEMVRAILDGRKTQTRRVIKPQPKFINFAGAWLPRCPYGGEGDRLWVRETFCPTPDGALYRATYRVGNPGWMPNRWKPSIFMPRWASRITLEVERVRIERVRAIKPEDAIREGYPTDAPPAASREVYINWFRDLWDSINAKRGFGWNKNPWVWVVEFKRVEQGETDGKEA